MPRDDMAGYLRTCRERLNPGDVGLPGGTRRRTPGLRREEVALLAGVSVDYLVRLEQGRGAQPSPQVLGSLSRALRLDDDETAYLFRAAGHEPPGAGSPSRTVRPGILRLLDRLNTPGLVVDAGLDVLAWNEHAAALLADFSALPAPRRNMAWIAFCMPGREGRSTPGDRESLARGHVADLRAASVQYPNDHRIAEVIGGLRSTSPEFARYWEEHGVTPRRGTTKRIDHPRVGLLELDCEVLHMPERGQRVVLHSAAPGSESAQRLELLGVIGLQTM